IAGGIYLLMATWKKGRGLVWERIRSSAIPLDKFIAEIGRREPTRVAGTAVYMAGNPDATPLALLHNLKHNKVLHRRVVVLTILVEEEARVEDDGRVAVEKLDEGFWRVRARYGFMEEPEVGDVLNRCAAGGLEFKPMETTFFLSRETIIPAGHGKGMAAWRERLFAVMARNATSATAYFRLPANRVVELGMQVEI
ncbi:MAG: KUP/HAK/KT family potassium transporter, partial [Verrucomicrobiota bacterium]